MSAGAHWACQPGLSTSLVLHANTDEVIELARTEARSIWRPIFQSHSF